MPYKLNPIFFRRLPASEKIVVSNLLGQWSILDNDALLNKLIIKNPPEERVDDFITKGFIEKENILGDIFPLAAEAKVSNRYRGLTNKPSLIMVVPTLRCDHNCIYCQVSRAPLTSEKHDLRLKPRVIANFIDEIAALDFKLEIQGGESLLAFDYVRDLVRALRELRGEEFQVVLCTALGPSLTDEILKWIRSENIFLSVSYDGIDSLHSKFRLHSSGRDSSKHLNNQLDLLKIHGVSERTSYVSTLTSSVLKLGAKEYINSCMSKGIRRIFSRPLSIYGFATTTNKYLGYSTEEYLRFLEDYVDEHITAFNNGQKFVDEMISMHLKRIVSSSNIGNVDMQSPAGYALSAAVINYDGHVFGSDEARMLYESTKSQDLPIGLLTCTGFSPQGSDLHEAVLSQSFLETTPYCETCAYLPYCGLDPISTINEHSNVVGYKPELSQCKITLGILDLLFERIADSRINSEMIKSWL